jgi:hypothetical protein
MDPDSFHFYLPCECGLKKIFFSQLINRIVGGMLAGRPIEYKSAAVVNKGSLARI